MSVKLHTLIVGSFLSLLFNHSIAASAAPYSKRTPKPIISVAHQKLTVHIDSVPLQEVLRELSDRLSLTITLMGDVGNTPLSASFDDVPLELGLEKLLRGQDYALRHKSPVALPGLQLKEIVVLPREDLSSNSKVEKQTVVMSPKKTSQESLGDSTPIHPQNLDDREPNTRELALQAEKLIELSDQHQSSSVSFLQKATQSQISEVRETAIALLEGLDQSRN